jgi:hypothetical protein
MMLAGCIEPASSKEHWDEAAAAQRTPATVYAWSWPTTSKQP